jgi:hypothetical protein
MPIKKRELTDDLDQWGKECGRRHPCLLNQAPGMGAVLRSPQFCYPFLQKLAKHAKGNMEWVADIDSKPLKPFFASFAAFCSNKAVLDNIKRIVKLNQGSRNLSKKYRKSRSPKPIKFK